MKAIIEIGARNSVFDAAMADIATGGNEDLILSFESARQFFTETTPARLIDLGLVEKTDGEMIHVLFDDIEVHFRLAQAA